MTTAHYSRQRPGDASARSPAFRRKLPYSDQLNPEVPTAGFNP